MTITSNPTETTAMPDHRHHETPATPPNDTYPMHVAEMQRWGDNDTHHYIVAVHRCPLLCAVAAMEEAAHRGGVKYDGVVFRFARWDDHSGTRAIVFRTSQGWRPGEHAKP